MPLEKKTKKSKQVEEKTPKKKTSPKKEEKPKTEDVKVVKKRTKKVEGKVVLPEEIVPLANIITPHKREFLNILEKMFESDKGIGHLLFNGIFRLAMNKRLYEFSDEEMIKAFSTQLNIMNKKQERAISEEAKIKKCRDLL